MCISPNAMIVHGIPGEYRAQGGRHHLVRRRRDEGRHDRRLGRDVRASARSRPRRSACSTSARPRSRPESRPRASARRSDAISAAVQTTTEEAGFAVVRNLVGHGVGRFYHEEPQVPNFVSSYARPGAPRGHDARDRADDHGRRRRTCTCTTTAGRSRPSTARWQPISSTPWRSPQRARGCSRGAHRSWYHDAIRGARPWFFVSRTGIQKELMASKEEKIEVEGEVTEALPSTMFRVQARRRARRPRDDLREDAQALHPHPPGRQGQGRAVAVRPDPRPHHLSPSHLDSQELTSMKVRPSVKPMCERCRVIKRHGRTLVICSNPRHKQRQG